MDRHRTSSSAQVVTAFAIVLAATWAFVAWMTLDDSHRVAQLMMPVDAAWSASTIGAVLAMWATMMVAMMLPSAAPMILTFQGIRERRSERRSGNLEVLVFSAAYVVAWIVFSILATGAQWALQGGGLLTPMGAIRSGGLASSIFILAGLYQFSSLKHACLGWCRSPLVFLMQEWREGLAGAWVMGSRHGLYCIGCCWALMLLLFVAGVMNPAWIVALMILVAFEKWPHSPIWIARSYGGILIMIGMFRLV